MKMLESQKDPASLSTNSNVADVVDGEADFKQEIIEEDTIENIKEGVKEEHFFVENFLSVELKTENVETTIKQEIE